MCIAISWNKNRIFKNNHVTGYDFPELVDNGGRALLEELKIEKATFRKKIVRLVNARMLGIGDKPEKPSGIKITLEGCSTAILHWKRTKADGFPIHKYRVQRRRLSSDDDLPYSNHSEMNTNRKGNDDGFCVKKSDATSSRNRSNVYDNFDGALVRDMKEMNFNEKEEYLSSEPNPPVCEKKSNINLSQRNLLEWQDVYDQSLSQFHDFGLERGQGGYQYRIQAWNAVGKSEWVLAEMKQWGRKKCDKRKNTKSSRSHPITSSPILLWFHFIWKSIHSLANIFFGLFGFIVAVNQLKRAVPSSTACRIDPIVPWLITGINSMLKSITGIDVVPQSLRYDELVNAVGLAGYRQVYQVQEDDNEVIDAQRPPVPDARTQIIRGDSERSEQRPIELQNNLCAHNHCNVCQKRYKFAKRMKHHCSKCFRTFCHKHGRTTHNNLVSCKVPGDCICDHCLELIDEQSRQVQNQ